MRRSTHFAMFVAPPEPLPDFEPLGDATLVARTANAARFKVGQTTVEVTALAADLFRVGIFGDGRPVSYASEAVAKTDWSAASTSVADDGTRITTDHAEASIELRPLRIGFRDRNSKEFAVDDRDLGAGFAPLAPAETRLVDPLGAPARVYKRHIPGTRYFGCGERTGGLDKTNSHQVFWNVDPPLGHTASLNNLYTSVPFVLALNE